MDQRLEMLRGGCSAVGWQTEDGKALWARNMDFNRMAAGSAVGWPFHCFPWRLRSARPHIFRKR